MYFQKDEIFLPREFPFKIFYGLGMPRPVPYLHWHDCLELNLIRGGTGKNIIGETEYGMRAGDIYIINNTERHYAFSDDTLEMLIIVFDPIFVWVNNTFDYDYLRPFFERSVNFCNCIQAGTKLANDIASIIGEIEIEFQQVQEGYRLIIKALLMKLLALLCRNFKLEGQNGDDLLEKQRDFEKIKAAVEHIDSHYTEKINQDELAKIAFMNPTYFSTYFKKVMKTSITDYMLSLRINHVARPLRQTFHSISGVAAGSGFGSISYFNRVFKRVTGCAPSEYRHLQKLSK